MSAVAGGQPGGADGSGMTTVHRLVDPRQGTDLGATAVIEPDGMTVTYGDLRQRSDAVAGWLLEHGIGPGAIVAVHAPRGAGTIAALLGISKSGNTYLPLDLDYPKDRIDFMVSDAAPAVVLCACADRAASWVSLATVFAEGSGAVRPDVSVAPEDPAYIIYTSGSTGVPKGVVVPHRAITNRVHWELEAFPVDPFDRLLHRTALSFDLSLWEILIPLAGGACVVVAEQGRQSDPRYLIDLIRQHRVTSIAIVPSLLQELMDAAPGLTECSTLRIVFMGGEVLPLPLHDRFLNTMPCRLVNMYGPTEYAIDATYWECHLGEFPAGVPIGYPIARTTVHLLDPTGREVPDGEPGEIVVSGAGMALGYLNRPELTAQRFQKTGRPGGTTVYFTGDIARRRLDGALEFLGRRDDQVKVNGNRVELGEVEAALHRVDGVRRASVVSRRVADMNALVAYVETTHEAGEGHIRRALGVTLPRYMIPSRIVFVDRLPVGPTGKVDRSLLPDLAAASAPTAEAADVGAQGQGIDVAGVFAEVLAREVGPDDDFFDLGGNSLQAIRVARRLQSALGRPVEMDALFDAPTPRSLNQQLGLG